MMAAATKTSLSNRTLHAINLCWSRCKKPGEVYFCLLGTKGLQAKVKNERFSAAGWRCRQSIKISRRHLADYVKTKIVSQ